MNRKSSIFLLASLVVCLSVTGPGTAICQSNAVLNEMLCVGAHWTEAEGAEFLTKMRKTYTTKKAWDVRAAEIRKQLLKGTGLEKFPKKNPLNPVFGQVREYDGYSVQNVAFESLPGVFVTGSLYSPTGNQNNLPGILSPHGHWNQAGDVGRYRADAQKRFASMARMGALVWAYDAVGYAEMEEIGWEHKHSDALKQQLWNSIRGVDFLLEMGANPDKIAVTGASGGGTQAFLLTAVDDRIAVSVPVVMVSAHFFGGCVCESGMPIHKAKNYQTNNVEIAALAAPRPMLLVSVGGDWTKNTPEVEFPHLQHIYALLDKRNLVENVHIPEDQHGYDEKKRKAVYPFLAKHLGLDLSKALHADGSLNETAVTLEDQRALYVFSDPNRFPAYGIKHNREVKWK
jgi:uncharacterized protein